MLRQTILAAALTVATSIAFADTPKLDRREANQEQRIEQGVNSGELTKPEANRLERSENRLDRHENHAEADGHVTAGERARLHREADRDSARIYRQKHDRHTRDHQNRK